MRTLPRAVPAAVLCLLECTSNAQALTGSVLAQQRSEGSTSAELVFHPLNKRNRCRSIIVRDVRVRTVVEDDAVENYQAQLTVTRMIGRRVAQILVRPLPLGEDRREEES